LTLDFYFLIMCILFSTCIFYELIFYVNDFSLGFTLKRK
jgi:hypothetical protein